MESEFTIGDSALRVTLAEMLAANADDVDLCEWLASAQVGDFYGAGETCTRAA